jgi:hypothetical protein
MRRDKHEGGHRFHFEEAFYCSAARKNAPVRKNRIDALGEVSQFQQAAGLFRTPASPVLKS